MLNQAQRDILKDAIFADPSLAALARAWDWDGLMAHYNTPGSGICWRSLVTNEEIVLVVDPEEYENISTLQHMQLQTLAANLTNGVRPYIPVLRTFFANIFTPTESPKTFAAIQNLWRRNMTPLEQLFAVGDGTTDSPSTLVVEGAIGAQELSDTTGKPEKVKAE